MHLKKIILKWEPMRFGFGLWNSRVTSIVSFDGPSLIIILSSRNVEYTFRESFNSDCIFSLLSASDLFYSFRFSLPFSLYNYCNCFCMADIVIRSTKLMWRVISDNSEFRLAENNFLLRWQWMATMAFPLFFPRIKICKWHALFNRIGNFFSSHLRRKQQEWVYQNVCKRIVFAILFFVSVRGLNVL